MRQVALAFTIMLSGPALAQTAPTVGDPVRCEREADCLSKLKGLAKRNGDALTLTLENGKSTTIRGNKRACGTDDDDKCLIQTLRAYLPAQKIFVVQWNESEDEGAAVFSATTGKSVGLGSLPEFSPDGQTFVSVDRDEMNGRDYDVAIWSVTQGTVKEEFRYKAPESDSLESWEFLGFDGNDRIKLKVSVSPAGGTMQVKETEAVRKGRGWALNWPNAKAK